jgi:hypothetical protein
MERVLLRRIVEESDSLQEYEVVDLIQELRPFLPNATLEDRLVTIYVDALLEILTQPMEALSVSDVVVTYTEALPLVCALLDCCYSQVKKHEAVALAFRKLQIRFASLRFDHKPTPEEYTRARFQFTAALLKRDWPGIGAASMDLAKDGGTVNATSSLLLSLKHR